MVIVSYHGGFERNLETGKVTETITGENQAYELCMEVQGIDVLLTGHQHRYIENKSINGVVVVQPGSGAKAIGKVEVSLKKQKSKWEVVEKVSKLIYCDGEQTDKKIESIVEEVEKDTQGWLDTSIGKINGDMRIHDYFQIRIKDSALIEFINRVQMDSSGAKISNTALLITIPRDLIIELP